MIARALSICLAALLTLAAAQPSTQDPVFTLDAVNPSLPTLDDPPNRETPQACVENLMFSAKAGDFERAAHSLNLRLLDHPNPERAALAAERLYYVLNQRLWISWEELPDRPDGQSEPATFGGDGSSSAAPRRAIRLGAIEAGGRDLPILIQRVRAGDADPVWLFSAQTVDNIDVLYDVHGPGWLERNMPDWARQRILGRISAWKWIALSLVLVLAPIIGWITALAVKRAVARYTPVSMTLLSSFEWPVGALVSTLILWALVQWVVSLPAPIAAIAEPLALVAVAIAATWLCMRVLSLIVDYVTRNVIPRLHEEESIAHRRILTQIKVARHGLMLIVALVALGIVLVQLDVFRTIGVALLSSAGAAAVILGLAGHAVLGNLIAGVQIAITQPFKLGDAVYIEDNWGQIEDIAYTYVVVRTWDKRRLVLPINYFIRNWFENWSMTDPFLTKPIYLHVDYRADVEAIRRRFFELLEADDGWDGEKDDPAVIVVETQDGTMVVRLTCGADNPSKAWWLHCRIREQLVAWLQERDGGLWLPRRRVQLDRREDGSERGLDRADSRLARR